VQKNKTNIFCIRLDKFRVWVAILGLHFTAILGFLIANSLCETIDSQSTKIQPHCYRQRWVYIYCAFRKLLNNSAPKELHNIK